MYTVGITSKDISTTKGNVVDYGIMGLAFQSGNAGVVSAYRLNQNKLPEQLYKNTMHEIGHTQGLPHCTVNSCYMRDCKGQNHWDEETGFCTNCKKTLQARGFKFEYMPVITK